MSTEQEKGWLLRQAARAVEDIKELPDWLRPKPPAGAQGKTLTAEMEHLVHDTGDKRMPRQQRLRADLWKAIRAYAKACANGDADTIEGMANILAKERAVTRSILRLAQPTQEPTS